MTSYNVSNDRAETSRFPESSKSDSILMLSTNCSNKRRMQYFFGLLKILEQVFRLRIRY